MFTKAIVLSETDFRLLTIDIMEAFVDYLRSDEEEKLEVSEAIKERMKDFFIVYFDDILESEAVEEAIIFIGGDAKEVHNGELYWSLVEQQYNIESLIKDYL